MVDNKVLACLLLVALVPILAQQLEDDHKSPRNHDDRSSHHHDDKYPHDYDHHDLCRHRQYSWSYWTSWSHCTRDCGGVQVRERKCCVDDPRRCKGDSRQERRCRPCGEWHESRENDERDESKESDERDKSREDSSRESSEEWEYDEYYRGKDGKLSTKCIVLIAAGTGGVLLLITITTCCCCRCYRKKKALATAQTEKPALPGTPPPVYTIDSAAYQKAMEAGIKPKEFLELQVPVVSDEPILVDKQ